MGRKESFEKSNNPEIIDFIRRHEFKGNSIPNDIERLFITDKYVDSIYHYTSPNSAISILESEEIWAGESINQNDEDEMYHGYRFFLERMRYFSDKYRLNEYSEEKKILD